MMRLVNVVIAIIFFWTNCVWAENNLAPQTLLAEVLANARVVYAGIEGLEGLEERAGGLKTLVFTERGSKAYYAFSPEGYIHRFTTAEDVTDPFYRLIERFITSRTERIKVGDYYQEVIQITPEIAGLVNACISKLYTEGEKRYISFRPMDLKSYSMAGLFEGVDLREGDRVFYDDGEIIIYWTPDVGNTIRVKTRGGEDLVLIIIDPFSKQLKYIYPKVNLDLIAQGLARVRDNPICDLIREALVLPDIDSELVKRVERLGHLDEIVPTLIRTNEVKDTDPDEEADRLIDSLVTFRYYPHWHVRRIAFEALERLNRVKPRLLPPERLREIDEQFLQENIRRDIAAIRAVFNTDLDFLRGSFKLPKLEIVDIDKLTVEYLDRGKEKSVYTAMLYLRDGSRFRIAIGAVRLSSNPMVFGDITLDLETKVMDIWNRLRGIDPNLVPELRAWSHAYGIERHLLPKPATGMLDREIDWEETLLLVARDFVEGITLKEIMETDLPGEEMRQAMKEAVKTYLRTWVLTRNKEGQGIFLRHPKPDSIILKKTDKGFGRGCLFDMESLDDNVTLGDALRLLSYYYPEDLINEALEDITEKESQKLPLGRVYDCLMQGEGAIDYSSDVVRDSVTVLSRLGLVEIIDGVGVALKIRDETVNYKVLSVFGNDWFYKDIPNIASELLRILEDDTELVWPIIKRLRAIVMLYKEVIPLVYGLRLANDEKERLVKSIVDGFNMDPVNYNMGVIMYLLRIAQPDEIALPSNDILEEARALWSISPEGIEEGLMDKGDKRLYDYVYESIERAKDSIKTDAGKSILHKLMDYWERNLVILGKDIDVKTTVNITDMTGKIPLDLIIKVEFYYRGQKIGEGSIDIDLSSQHVEIGHVRIMKKGHGLEGELAERIYLIAQFMGRVFGMDFEYMPKNWQKEFYEDRIRKVYGDNAWERIREHIDFSRVELINKKEITGAIRRGVRDYINRHSGTILERADVIRKAYRGLLSIGGDLVSPIGMGPVRHMTALQEKAPMLDIEQMFSDGGYATEFSPLYIWEEYLSIFGNTIDVRFIFRLGGSVRLFTLRLPKEPSEGLDDITDNFMSAYLYNLMVSRGADSIGVYTEEGTFTDRLINKLSHKFPLEERLNKAGKPGYSHIRSLLKKVYGKKVRIYRATHEEIEDIEHPNVNVIADTNLPLLHRFKTTRGVIAGVDAGGTDIKVVLYKDEKLVYAKEHNWDPGKFTLAEQHIGTVEALIKFCLIRMNLDSVQDEAMLEELEGLSDPRTGIERIRRFIAKAEDRLGKDLYNNLEAVGISWPEVVVGDRMVPFSGKVKGLNEEELAKIARLRDEISNRFGKIPTAITNDGNMGAFWGGVELAKGNLIGISMGTSCGVGYLDREGRITDMLTEMGKAVINLTDDPATSHVSTGVSGVAQRHLSQDGVFRAAEKLGMSIGEDMVKIFVARGYAERLGIDISGIGEGEIVEYVYSRLPADLQGEYRTALVSKGERLKYIQSLLDSGDEKAEEVFKEIGRYLACFIGQIYLYFDESGTRNIVLFGRVINGKAGDIIISTARQFLAKMLPWLPDINLYLAPEITDTPDTDRFGQAQGAVYLGYKRLIEERVYRFIQRLKEKGVPARINGRLLCEIESPELLLRHITDYTPLKNPVDILDILEARLSDREIFLYNSIFNQEGLLRNLDRPINIVMFRGGRGVGELTRLMNGVPNINISAVLGGTDDGRSWYYAAQDFDATGVPDCGKTLLDLAGDSDVAKLLETRLKGEGRVLRKELEQLIEKLEKGEKTQWIAKFLKEFMIRLRDDYSWSSFSLNNIPIRSIVLVGASWYFKGDWQRAVDEVAGLLDIKPGNKVAFSTLERVHLVGLTKDGIIYFTETGINEHPKKGDFIGLWLFKKKPDIERIAGLLMEEGIELESVEIPLDMPDELKGEILETSRAIKQEERINDAAVILSGLSYRDIGGIVINPVAIDAIQNADIIIYGPSSLESNIGSGLLPRGIQNAIRDNDTAVKIFFVNPTIENEPRDITAYSMLEKLYRYVTGQQPYRVDDAVWDGGYIDYILGRGLQYMPRDPRKRYVPFDDMDIEKKTGGDVVPIVLNLEWDRLILKERKDYGGHEKEYGFYSPQVMLENLIALWVLNRMGFKIEDGSLKRGVCREPEVALEEDPSINDLREEDIVDKAGIVRVGTDVLDKKGGIKSDKRIKILVPTIDSLFRRGARYLILCAYFGRPERGDKNKDQRYAGVLYDNLKSGRPIADRLQELTGRRVHFIPAVDPDGRFLEDYKDYLTYADSYIRANVRPGELVFLDNLRFWDEEDKRSAAGFSDFAERLAGLGSFYVQEGYPQAHRPNSTVVSIADHFNGRAVFGDSYLAEIRFFNRLRERLNKRERGPINFVLAGVKIETKPGVISKITVTKKLLERFRKGDYITLGGAVAYTFIVAQYMIDNTIEEAGTVTDEVIKGLVGDSLVQRDLIPDALFILRRAREKGINVLLPVDHRVTDKFENNKLPVDANISVVESNIPIGLTGVDIGPKTEEIYIAAVKKSETILIAGPLGVIEDARTAIGSINLVKAMGEVTKSGAETIAAGGETEALIAKAGVSLSHVSTGGGAALEDIEKDGDLPGTLAVRRNRPKKIGSPQIQGSHIVRDAKDGEEERELNNLEIDGDGQITIRSNLSPFPNILQLQLDKLGKIYGKGIFTLVNQIRIVENLGGGGIYPDGRAPLASFRDGVLRIDELAFRYGEYLLFEELEHEFLESIAVLIPGATHALADVISTFRNVKRFLELNSGEQDGFLSMLRGENPIDPDGEYLALLEGVRSKKNDDKIIASVVRYALRTKLYENVRDELGLPEELAGRIRDLEPRLDDALAVFNEVKEAAGLVEKVKESSELAISVIKTFNGIRVQGLDKIDKKLAEVVAVLVKIASKTGRIASLPLAMAEGRYYIVVDRNRVTKEMEEAIRKLEKNNVFKVVYTVPEDYEPKKIIYLVDPADLREGMQEGILYLPMPYLRSSLYMAAVVVSAGGNIDKIDPLIKGLIADLYNKMLGRDITEQDLKNLFTAPWLLLPEIRRVLSEIDFLHRALAELEKAA